MSATTCIRRSGATYTSCTCPPCIQHNRRNKKLYAVGKMRPARSDEAWAVVDARLARGWTPTAIASAAGLSAGTMGQALRARQTVGRNLTRALAEPLIASAEWPTAGEIGSVGSSRRLQAVSRMGWTIDHMAARTGMSVTTLRYIRDGTGTHVKARNAAAIRALYVELAMVPGPSEQARRRATQAGYVSALAWEDIDDPAEVAHDGTPTHPVLDLDEWLLLVRNGESPARAAARCGVTVSAVEGNARRHGRPEIVEMASAARAAQRRAS